MQDDRHEGDRIGMLMDAWRRNRESVARAGQIALDRARAAGVPAFYMEPSSATAIIVAFPDGTRREVSAGEAAGIADRD